MTKVITILTIALFSIGIQTQDAKSTPAKTICKADVEKCKTEDKTCDKDLPVKDKKSCCAKA
ncbi:hypothetical protein [Flavobacterium reichenbachii]|uniref:Uncharacterized protein n=1 Tax=Flavobacterium reichenbachii TaxID=362418 RepID=A0A085ZKX1_9FLAO|nr:hypothetical protein [Flavobacterium reichenbachii]KFF05085.1 hypothetical protein IW19_05880 [Flavobacterium reichenbachii]OXB16244.1 hypothetical protein B0A68_08275 [Flavobacterium reichenbachii]